MASQGTIVTLLTDFGTVDGFVGAMKGVILRHAPACQVVDLTHEIAPHNIRGGARALMESTPYFPPGSIHVAVVDPGVGTTRRPLLLQRPDGHLLVGPDNGLLSLCAPPKTIGYVLDDPSWFLDRVSSTFHGRDIFASIAGFLAAGIEPARCGTITSSWQQLEEPIAKVSERLIQGQVVHIDRFGNLITNIDKRFLDKASGWRVYLGDRAIGHIQSTFGDVPSGEWVAYIGSGGQLEIAVNEGDASKMGVTIDSEVTLCR